MNVFNFSRKKVGGIWFVKLGRFTVSFSVSRAYRPIGYPQLERELPLWRATLEAAQSKHEGGNEIAMVVSSDR